jgi:hypothetical protein
MRPRISGCTRSEPFSPLLPAVLRLRLLTDFRGLDLSMTEDDKRGQTFE